MLDRLGHQNADIKRVLCAEKRHRKARELAATPEQDTTNGSMTSFRRPVKIQFFSPSRFKPNYSFVKHRNLSDGSIT